MRLILALMPLLHACAAGQITVPPPGEVAKSSYDFQDAIFPEGAPPRSMELIDVLDGPVLVRGWSRDTLLLADGRSAPIEGVGDLRRFSLLLSECAREGVEVRGATIVALVRIWHWCGNDPVARHLARVDVGDLLRYHVDDVADDRVVAPDGFTPSWGWHINGFRAFREWQRARADAAPPALTIVLRKDADVLVMFSDGWFRYARGGFEGFASVKTKVYGGYLSCSLTRHILERGESAAGLVIPRVRSRLGLDP